MNIKKHIKNKALYLKNSGRYTYVYFLPCGKSVLKLPQESEFYDGFNYDWSQSISIELDCKKVLRSMYGEDLALCPVNIANPEGVLKEDNVIIAMKESKVSGAFFTKGLYENSPEDYAFCVKGIAELLNNFHQYSYKNNIHEITENNDKYFSLEMLDLTYSGLLKDDDKDYFTHIINDFHKRTVGNETILRIHGDLRSGNILVDYANQRAGVIDFASSSVDNIYLEFANMCKIWELGFKFTSDIVRDYNSLPKEYPSHIDIEKVAMFSTILTLQRGMDLDDTLSAKDKAKALSGIKEFRQDIETILPNKIKNGFLKNKTKEGGPPIFSVK
jgi:thiamine kinase-like enzyme